MLRYVASEEYVLVKAAAGAGKTAFVKALSIASTAMPAASRSHGLRAGTHLYDVDIDRTKYSRISSRI